MNRRQGDLLVGIVTALVVFGGGVLTWRAVQQRRTADGMMGSMMGGQMGSVHGPDPIVYALGTLLLAVVVVALYLIGRDSLAATPQSQPDGDASGSTGNSTAPDAGGPATEPGDRAATDTSSPAGSSPNGGQTAQERAEPSPDRGPPETNPTERVLDLLPDDERRVLQPVLDSPGITQIELRDRADFSKSKVSQTVSDLEERGLLYRERQGRTYRVYPSDDLAATE